MTKLHIGVNDVTELDGTPTYDVAMILEDKYTLFSKFAESEMDSIVAALTKSVNGAIFNVEAGAPAMDPFKQGTSQIVADFQRFLDIEKMATLGVPGVPTKAALMGVNSRKKIRKGPRRPSFIDTGILQANIAAWIEN